MVTLYLDTEFNGFGGSLISLALYNPAGPSFYEVLPAPDYPELDPWVGEHVLPCINQAPLPRPLFSQKLRSYLQALSRNPTIIADWPADFVHLFDALMIEGHWEVDIPLTAALLHSPPLSPAIPHNALSDAEALAKWHLGLKAA